ncbi:unnamed protein product [Polarella glacialis]|uniref:Uncharacterized protein n=1 Tax=Polarella glacialis TaxID=89957 RepID=A0A813GBC3_POLGL|nr:unnamed protein product [Polarella glacialis]
MAGQTLSKYMMQLSEKENLLLERELRQRQKSTQGAVPARQAGPLEAREPPNSETAIFEKSSLAAVLGHMCDYEAVSIESTKALRALASLAFSQGAEVGNNDLVLGQLLRLLQLHPSEGVLQLAGMKTLCHLAFVPDVALGKLAKTEMLTALLATRNRTVGDCSDARFHAEASERASEALARIVASEAEAVVAKGGAEGGPGLTSLFEVVSLAVAQEVARGTWTPGPGGVQELIARLLEGELVQPAFVVESLVSAAPILMAAGVDSDLATGWIAVLRHLGSGLGPAFNEVLVAGGAVAATLTLMELHSQNLVLQSQGMACLFLLLDTCRKSAPKVFAEASGTKRTMAAMIVAPEDVALQSYGIRLLVSVLDWPISVQRQAQLNFEASVTLTKKAMQRNLDSSSLQVVALTALAKYLEDLGCVTEVKEGGMEGLIKAVMTRPDTFGYLRVSLLCHFF